MTNVNSALIQAGFVDILNTWREVRDAVKSGRMTHEEAFNKLDVSFTAIATVVLMLGDLK